MVAKPKTYGKKRERDLVASFNQLALSPKKDEIVLPRVPLEAISTNVVLKKPEGCIERQETASSNAVSKKPEACVKTQDTEIETPTQKATGSKYDPSKPITALTSLECVEPEIQCLHNACKYWEENLTVTKIAQGSYATILRMQMKSEPDVYTVWKLIPLKPKTGKGCRAPDQTQINDAAAEVKALALMAEVEGFVEFRSARVLRGSMPPLLQKLNKEWEIKHPDEGMGIKYSKSQMWLLVEMSDAGTDLETLLKKGSPDGELLLKAGKLTIEQTWDIFWGTAEALARGEALTKFEHRDLHPGNVCISRRTIPSPDTPDDYSIPKHTDLEVTIIDYTLSRATLENGEILANSMRDGGLFEQSSPDLTDDRQYDMYRHMKTLIKSEPNMRCGEIWHEFVPMTNIMWLYHILKYLLDSTESYPPDRSRKVGKISKERKLADRLGEILERIDPMVMDEWLYLSAGDLVNAEVVWEGGIERAVVAMGIDGVSEVGEVMARHRRARWRRCKMKVKEEGRARGLKDG